MNELTISLDTKSSRPLYEQIYQYIKEEIQNGGLPFQERLPSTRNLASYLQVSRSTVELAYDQLIAEGYIEARPCRGFFVNNLEGLYRLKPEKQAANGESGAEEAKEHYRFDFSPSGVDLNSFPHNAWKKLSRAILMEEKKEFFQLGDPQGEFALRKVISGYLHQARGVSAPPERIVIGAGNDFLLLLLCGMLGSGQRVAMEDPTYKKAYDVLDTFGMDMVTIPMDRSGMSIRALEESGASIAYVMPAHQFPLGIVMPVKRRLQLLDWASAAPGRYIIEDDYDSEFRYKGKPIPALQGYDHHGRVIYMGTFSRSIAPAIRVSYLVLPEELMELYEKKGRAVSCTVSRVDQLLITRFLQEGYFERHLNKMRALYKGRHDVLLEQLSALPEGCTVSGEHAGVHVLVSFSQGMSEEEAVRRAAGQGVKVYGLSDCRVGEHPATPEPPTVILGYAKLDEEEIKEAVNRLLTAWSQAKTT